MSINGHTPGGPLNLTPAQRHAILAKNGLGMGWVLLSVSEMYEMKKTMDACQKENDRLNKQTAKLQARRIVEAAVADKGLRSARKFCELVANASNEQVSATYRFDAVNEVSNIDEALSCLPETPKEEQPHEDKPGV